METRFFIAIDYDSIITPGDASPHASSCSLFLSINSSISRISTWTRPPARTCGKSPFQISRRTDHTDRPRYVAASRRVKSRFSGGLFILLGHVSHVFTVGPSLTFACTLSRSNGQTPRQWRGGRTCGTYTTNLATVCWYTLCIFFSFL